MREAQLVSVNVGLPRDVTWRGEKLSHTAHLETAGAWQVHGPAD